MEYGTVEFANDVHASMISGEDDERACVSGTHFSVERFLDCGVSEENERAFLEVEVMYRLLVRFLESNRCDTSG